MSGRLQLITTPIGNLGEICPRAIEALRAATRLYAENTQTAQKLLNHCGVTGKAVRPIHDGSEKSLADGIAKEVSSGVTVAYISEAGAPCISDPGFRLVRACRKIALPVEAIGMPSAFLNALIISGLPTDLFTFAGFSPPKTVGRKKFFQAHCFSEATAIFYESCHRLEKSLADLREVVGDKRLVCLCAELTKLHEASQTTPMAELKIPTNPKGEWVIVVAKDGFEL